MRLYWTKRVGCRLCWQRLILVAALVFFPCASVLAATAAAPVSLDEAVAQVEREHSGRVLSARVEERDGGVVYLIRLLTEDQQVRTFEIPASEGVRP